MRTKWTVEKALQVASKFKNPSDLKKANVTVYRIILKNKLTEMLWPVASRMRHEVFTLETLKKLMKERGYVYRADMQHGFPSAYNAAKSLRVLDELFPPARNAKKWNLGTLRTEASKYKTRKEFYDGSPGPHAVACKMGLLNELSIPKNGGISEAELELLEFLKTLKEDFKSKRFANDYEVDCYSEELRIGIEYNGLYWHSEATGKTPKYHVDKTKYFNKKGIRLIHVWEHEWRDRRDQTKNFLRSACGGNVDRIGARKCVFETISTVEATAFLRANHIQGSPRNSSLALGVKYQDELVGVATFGKHHRQNGLKHVVLNRMAFKPGLTVSGAVQKLTKLAFEQFGPLQSWADRDKSDANGYLKAGWVLKRTLGPDYFYVKPGYPSQVISKQSRKKSQVKTPKDVSERDHAVADGLTRVWNCGKFLLTYG